MALGEIVFASRSKEKAFRDPDTIVSAQTMAEVLPALEQVQHFVDDGKWAAGFVSYDAAPAFDPAFECHAPSDVPLVWFGIYEKSTKIDPRTGSYVVSEWESALTRDDYRSHIKQILDYISAGDTYQVNYTFPLHATFSGDAFCWFRDLRAAQQADYCAYVDTGRFKIICVSPEQFFTLKDGVLRTRPMKGTRPRGRWLEEDEHLAEELLLSEKDRAENVMIVDLLRNDMGRISDTGSVHVEQLFAVERYPTVWQMTSRIASRTRARMPEIMRALFPSGSVTGAPKVRTMQLLAEFEQYPRGVYCGAIGWISPAGNAAFNVAIRCATIDGRSGVAEYPVGSGITWDSNPESEFLECLSKAAVLTTDVAAFDLFETVLFHNRFFLAEEHIARLLRSARYFGIRVEAANVREALAATVQNGTSAPMRIRVLVNPAGQVRVESQAADKPASMRVGLARKYVQSTDIHLFHKTTHRAVYDQARATRPDCDDVILWNERGELTESTIANIVLELDGKFVTPPVSCGLLAGTFREHLLRNHVIHERVLEKADLRRAKGIYLINSVRRWVPATLVDR
ncbi:MAG: aminodeoxychorismate synthase component I [Candidatus Hydrogenedentes bacterium]|nr:aminodeoxychorismate synthase component I [Candidatus Hydrogenedentota bacterium]